MLVHAQVLRELREPDAGVAVVRVLGGAREPVGAQVAVRDLGVDLRGQRHP
jgi:hypothetical protein